MAISMEDVEHVALLARLALSEEEKELFRRQLSDVLDHARKISAVDTEGIPATSHAYPLANVYREDEVRESITMEEATANADWAEDGSFRVPRIV